jgi:hypothetical protein
MAVLLDGADGDHRDTIAFRQVLDLSPRILVVQRAFRQVQIAHLPPSFLGIAILCDPKDSPLRDHFTARLSAGERNPSPKTAVMIVPLSLHQNT